MTLTQAADPGHHLQEQWTYLSRLSIVAFALQGIRGAVPQDLAAIQGLLLPLEERGILAPRTDEQLLTDLRYFRVAERDAKVSIRTTFIHICS